MNSLSMKVKLSEFIRNPEKYDEQQEIAKRKRFGLTSSLKTHKKYEEKHELAKRIGQAQRVHQKPRKISCEARNAQAH